MDVNVSIYQMGNFVEAFAKKLNVDVETVAQKIALDTWRKLTLRTPVDTGRARASWDIAQGTPSGYLPEEGNHGAPSAPNVSAIDGRAVIYVTSNLIYMEPLEYGHSKQAPHGMIRITLAEIAAEIDVIISRL